MADSEAKKKWMEENTLNIAVRINRNQDPELFAAFLKAKSKGQLARELMQVGYRYCMETLTEPETE